MTAALHAPPSPTAPSPSSARRPAGRGAIAVLGLGAAGLVLVGAFLSLRAVTGVADVSPGVTGVAGRQGAVDLEHGRRVYLSTCAACHGPGGGGVPRQGPALAGSRFVREADGPAMLQFLRTGRAAGDPASLTGLPMPPRGGNPSLTDADLAAAAAYVGALQAGRATAGGPIAGGTHAEQP